MTLALLPDVETRGIASLNFILFTGAMILIEPETGMDTRFLNKVFMADVETRCLASLNFILFTGAMILIEPETGMNTRFLNKVFMPGRRREASRLYIGQ